MTTTCERFSDLFRASQAVSARADRVLAGGVSHDSWATTPFPVSIVRSEGAYKWEAGGRKLIDLWMGHGALLCGHGFPPVVRAVTHQVEQGFHYAGLHELQVRWAELVCRLVPSAELVRFTSSGTEATLLAIRVARALTGRQRLLRFDGHFHGWHDESLVHFFPCVESGLNHNAGEGVELADARDLAGVRELLQRRETAAVILEPGGGTSGGVAVPMQALRQLRDIASETGTILIFDEVVSGFRCSPGGVQELAGVMPDLTVLAKILCGGMPGGAVCGRRDMMCAFGGGADAGGRRVRVPHTGTFNGNPISAAAGVAMLEAIGDGEAQKAAAKNAAAIAGAANVAARDAGVDAVLRCQSSTVHIVLGEREHDVPVDPSASVVSRFRDRPDRYMTLRRALLCEGIDCHPVHGWVSTCHTDEVAEQVARAFSRALVRLADYDPGVRLRAVSKTGRSIEA